MDAFLAAVSGALLARSFPQLGHPAFAWIALAPLLIAVARRPSPSRGLRLGLLTGAVHFAFTIAWIPQVMVEYGGLSTATAWLVHGLLVAYLALFPALVAAGLGALVRQQGPAALLYTPALWVTGELGRIHLFTGFPWALLGYSQLPFLPVAQVASLVGVLGLSALVASGSTALAFAVLVTNRRRWPVVGVVALVVGVSFAFGAGRLAVGRVDVEGPVVHVAAAQGNIAQDDKWDPSRRQMIVDRYVELTHRAAAAGAQLVIWPEAATPFAFSEDPAGAARIRGLARETGVHLIFGTTHVTRGDEAQYYNAAVSLDEGGNVTGVYRKQHLVPFGEYVPLRELLFFVAPLVEAVGEFSVGPGPEPLPMGEYGIGTAICYEVIYPGLVRELVASGSQLLITVTNDAWYGRSSAPYQHFEQARMRAIEQGRYLVRAANTGISGVVDPYGRVVVQTPLFETQVVSADVRLLERRTLYSRIGDLFAYLCGIVTIGALAATAWRPRAR